MAKGADKKKKKTKDEKEKEKDKDKIKLKRGKSGDLTEETGLEVEVPVPAAQSEENLVCQVMTEQPEEEPVPESLDTSPEATLIYYEEPVLTKLIVTSYEGETVRGLYEGVGIARFQGGHVYEGVFSEGLMHGRGTYVWANGIKYEGDFSMNIPTGHGTYTWTDGSTYVGDVQDGIRHGQGTFMSADRSISYTGDWYYGKRHGKGTIYYNEEGSSWYQGDWVNNVREGWGTRRYKSGNVYEGEWKNFTRHGEGTMSWISTNEEYTGQWENGIQGTFVFKNGRTYEGEFLEDRMAEFPNFSIDGMNTPDLSTIRTQSPVETGSVKKSESNGVIQSVLQHNVELNIESLLENIPVKDREHETFQVKYAILRHFTQLKRIYRFYSSLGHQESPDNTFLLSQLQFWRFLKDCKFHHYGLSLANMDRILHEQFTVAEDTHSPFDTLLLEKFLSCIVILAYHIYHKEHEGRHPILEACFSKLMTDNLIPYACTVNGSLFQQQESTTIVLGYINKCWEVYRTYCKQNRRPPNTSIMTMRHFLWMIKDLNLLSNRLTATCIVEILSQDNPAVSDGTYNNMDIEMVFLEFLEALLSCTEVYVTKRMLENSEASSTKSSGVNITLLTTTTSAQLKQEPLDLQVSVQEHVSPEPNGHGLKSLTKKRGEANGGSSKKSERKKNKPSASSAEKSSKSSAHHDQIKSAALSKPSQKEEELSRNVSPLLHPVASSAPSGDTLSEISEHGKTEVQLQVPRPVESLEEKVLTVKVPGLKPVVKSGSELEFWLSQICFFFMKRLFPAFEHAEVLKLEAKRDMVRKNELAHQARMESEGRARSKGTAVKCSSGNELPLNVENTVSLSDEEDKISAPTHKDIFSAAPTKKSNAVKKKKRAM
ncbi:radial spoke head 10 homolog B isoform X5 [Hypanus sabinus]|uniref:radial spoke head 10 homolog B isoform X5 n=1 Tax=Hypanus sabinus TaxID=79690 RepID=UPI0028C3BB7B|nr:radial spoke head 10 homolog B isoform X5 [Hypanus sabinus]